MLISKSKKIENNRGTRILVSITVSGSPGPIRFIVFENELVNVVIDRVLKVYAREGRLPLLGFNASDFNLLSTQVGYDVLSPWMPIGSFGVRNFMLCKKPQPERVAAGVAPAITRRTGSRIWKNCFNKLLNLKISSH